MKPAEGRPTWIAVAGGLLVLLAVLQRLAHSWAVRMPSNDGVHYLWMAERMAEGAWGEALSSTFAPGWPLLLAPGILAGMEPFFWAKVLGSLLGGIWVALQLLLIWRIAAAKPALMLALLAALSFPGVRLVGDVSSELLYMPLVTGVLLLALDGKTLPAALLLGLASWVRPEALCLLPMLAIGPRGWRLRPLLPALTGFVLVFGLPLLARVLFPVDPDRVGKLALAIEHGPLGQEGVGSIVQALLNKLWQVPHEGLKSLDHVGFAFGVFGLWLLHRKDRREALPWLLSLGAGWMLFLLFEVKARFFLSQAPLLLPLAGLVCIRWPRNSGPILLGALLLAAALVGLDLGDPPRKDRGAEIAVGRYLGDRLGSEDELVTDMPRIAHYAGRQPPVPRRWTAERLEEQVRELRPRYLVLGIRRQGRARLLEGLAGYEPLAVPPQLKLEQGMERISVRVRKAEGR